MQISEPMELSLESRLLAYASSSLRSAPDELRRDPTPILTRAGLTPDPWQEELLRTDAKRILICCSRQSGKSQTAAAMALLTALVKPPAMILIISRSLRQSVELFRKVKELYRSLRPGQFGRPKRRFSPRPVKVLDAEEELLGVTEAVVQESVLQLELANGSRIISLPGKPETIVGYSAVDLLIIDEAARTSDDLYRSVRPMLAVSDGRLIGLSTPFGKRGWFYEAWYKGAGWERVQVTAPQCPRITPEFLREEAAALGERWFRQEYLCSFEEPIDSVFREADIQAALDDTLQPLFGVPRQLLADMEVELG